MSTITKERVAEIIHADGLEPCDYEAVFESIKTGEIVAMARIALASLEAEAVGFIARHKETGKFGSYLHPKADWFKNDDYEVLSAYTAPPAPVSVPDDVLKGLLPDAEKAEFWFEHNGKILFEGVKFNNAVFDACRAAMLQGADRPQNEPQNIPEIIPGGLVEAVNNLLNNDGSRGRYSAIGCGEAREKIELWLAQRQKWESQRRENLAAGNSPVIPDGWVLVPVEPTEQMIMAAGPNCQDAFDYLRTAYKDMLAAAPLQEVK